MVIFDRALEYRFSFFMRPQKGSEPEWKELPHILGQPSPNAKGLGLKLGHAEQEDGLLVSEGMPSPVPLRSRVWRAGGNIWTLELSRLRLDLTFDAKGFQDISETDVPIEAIRERVTTNLVEGLAYLGQPIVRFALNFWGQSSCAGNQLKPAEIVARSFFNTVITEKAKAGEILDLAGRVNNLSKLTLPQQNEEQNIEINRIENGSASMKVEDRQPLILLDWRYDVNTSGLVNAPFSLDAVPTFLAFANVWVTGQLGLLNEIAR